MRGLVLMAPHFIVEDVTINSIREIRQAFDTTDVRQRFQRWHADADATVAELRRRGVEIEVEPWDFSAESRIAFVKGPDNVRIELVQPRR